MSEQQQVGAGGGLHHRHAAATKPPPGDDAAATSTPADVAADVEAQISSSHGNTPHKDADVAAALPAATPGSVHNAAADGEELFVRVTYWDIFKQFSILGWTAFGGPAAHIGLFQRVS
jgi:hypothetical protein